MEHSVYALSLFDNILFLYFIHKKILQRVISLTPRSCDCHVPACDSTDRSYSKAAVGPVSCIWCGSRKSLPCELRVRQTGTLELLNKGRKVVSHNRGNYGALASKIGNYQQPGRTFRTHQHVHCSFKGHLLYHGDLPFPSRI